LLFAPDLFLPILNSVCLVMDNHQDSRASFQVDM
jgi:hypothetical protein